MLRALEFHVLDEVGQPLLVLVFQHGARLDDEAQLGAPDRLRIGAHVVAQAVRQRAGDDLGIDRHLLGEGVWSDGSGGRLAAWGRRLRGNRRQREQTDQNSPDGKAGAR